MKHGPGVGKGSGGCEVSIFSSRQSASWQLQYGSVISIILKGQGGEVQAMDRMLSLPPFKILFYFKIDITRIRVNGNKSIYAFYIKLSNTKVPREELRGLTGL